MLVPNSIKFEDFFRNSGIRSASRVKSTCVKLSNEPRSVTQYTLTWNMRNSPHPCLGPIVLRNATLQSGLQHRTILRALYNHSIYIFAAGMPHRKHTPSLCHSFGDINPMRIDYQWAVPRRCQRLSEFRSTDDRMIYFTLSTVIA